MADARAKCERCASVPPVTWLTEIWPGRVTRLCEGCCRAHVKLVREWLTKGGK